MASFCQKKLYGCLLIVIFDPALPYISCIIKSAALQRLLVLPKAISVGKEYSHDAHKSEAARMMNPTRAFRLALLSSVSTRTR